MDEEKRYAQELAKLGRAIEAGERPRLSYAEIIRLARALGVESSSLFVRAESLSVE